MSHLDGKGHSRSVKSYCKLNEIPNFHVTSNYSLDIMHILLEGILPFELGCNLHSLCQERLASFTMQELNRRIQVFWSVINVDKKNKPPHLNNPEKGQRISPSLKAVQSWSLLKYLLLLMGDIVPSNNKHWKLLLSLCHLVDISFSPYFTTGTVYYLEELIADHLHMFKDVFGDDVKLKPKHHLLIHLPSVILHSGPLISMNCLRYELKNYFTKRCANTVSNFRNICHTLANRHQQNALYAKLSSSHMRDVVTLGKYITVVAHALVFHEAIYSKFDVSSTDDIMVAKNLLFASVEYRCNQTVITDIDAEGEPVYGVI